MVANDRMNPTVSLVPTVAMVADRAPTLAATALDNSGISAGAAGVTSLAPRSRGIICVVNTMTSLMLMDEEMIVG